MSNEQYYIIFNMKATKNISVGQNKQFGSKFVNSLEKLREKNKNQRRKRENLVFLDFFEV